MPNMVRVSRSEQLSAGEGHNGDLSGQWNSRDALIHGTFVE